MAHASLDRAELKSAWQEAASESSTKIIVLDDDPTGTQTVHDVPVYTSWGREAIVQARQDSSGVVYILTNSRSLSPDQSRVQHEEIARNLKAEFVERGQPFVLVSRSDSTLRGHYPLETQTLRQGLLPQLDLDGEIIAPFFKEGGRLTLNDVHYVKEGDELIPAAQTQFARDPAFGYQSSNLKEWIAEKTRGAVGADQVKSISLDMLRGGGTGAVADALAGLSNFEKLIVNAEDYSDLWAFYLGLARAWAQGKNFMFRSAASLVRVMAGQDGRPLLSRAAMVRDGGQPGLIMVGSFVPKTSRQLDCLRELGNMEFVEWRVAEAAQAGTLAAEAARVAARTDAALSNGRDACIYTSREFSDAGRDSLDFSAQVSKGLCGALSSLKKRPGWLVAKGGITSSDLAVKALGVKRARVLGQVLPGVPVWDLGQDCRLPGVSYVVFPGNVGGEDALAQVVQILRGA
jgi:uncharacterized protein YgbK (DUF1537 family)